MKLILLLVSLGLATILSDNNTELLKTLSERYQNFTSQIYNEAVLESPSNYAVCPASLNFFFTIIYAGVKENSAKRISNYLQIPKSSEVIHETINDLARTLSRDDYLNFDNINKIYVQDGFQISNTYKRTLIDIFKGDIDNIDFKQPEKAVKTVTSWIYEKSNQLIFEDHSVLDFNERSTMLLISTMNFRGLFTKNLFKEESTIKRDFYSGGRNSGKTDMMEAFCNCSYYESEELDAKFLKLNFTNIADGSITFILPNDKEGYEDLKYKMDQVFIKPNYSNEYVHIIIPRFRITSETFDYFRKSLAVKIGDAFEEDANFTGIGANQDPLRIKYISSNIVLEVNENGAGTTSATYSMLDSIPAPEKDGPTSYNFDGAPSGGSSSLDFNSYVHYVQSKPKPKPKPKPNIFQAHHPFIYYITVNDVNIAVGICTYIDLPSENEKRIVFPVESLDKAENETKLENRKQPIEVPMTYIVEEYTCPCNLN